LTRILTPIIKFVFKKIKFTSPLVERTIPLTLQLKLKVSTSGKVNSKQLTVLIFFKVFPPSAVSKKQEVFKHCKFWCFDMRSQRKGERKLSQKEKSWMKIFVQVFVFNAKKNEGQIPAKYVIKI